MYIVKKFVSGKVVVLCVTLEPKRFQIPSLILTNWQVLGKLPNLPRLTFLYLKMEILTRLIPYCG